MWGARHLLKCSKDTQLLTSTVFLRGYTRTTWRLRGAYSGLAKSLRVVPRCPQVSAKQRVGPHAGQSIRGNSASPRVPTSIWHCFAGRINVVPRLPAFSSVLGLCAATALLICLAVSTPFHPPWSWEGRNVPRGLLHRSSPLQALSSTLSMATPQFST